jgi:hypothetical protein
MIKRTLGWVVCGWLIASGTLLAHHSLAATYDIRKESTVTDPVVLVEPWVMTPRIMRLTPGANAGLLPERGNCDTSYEREAIETQIRH